MAIRPTLFPHPPCASNTATPTHRGQGRDSLGSLRTGNGQRRTQRSTTAKAQATAACPAGLLNPDAEWHEEPDEPSPCPPPRAASRAARRVAPPCPLRQTERKTPPEWQSSGACTAAAAPPVPSGCPCSPPALSPLGLSARCGHFGPPATAHAAGFITPPHTRVSVVSPAAFAGADQGVTPSRPFARHYATCWLGATSGVRGGGSAHLRPLAGPAPISIQGYVAYLLNIGIFGPVAPLTGQYSSGGLN